MISALVGKRQTKIITPSFRKKSPTTGAAKVKHVSQIKSAMSSPATTNVRRREFGLEIKDGCNTSRAVNQTLKVLSFD